MNKNNLPENAAEALKVISNLTFRDFTSADWRQFSGCDSENPKLAGYGNEENGTYVDVVIDGDVLFFWNCESKFDDAEEWVEFQLSNM